LSEGRRNALKAIGAAIVGLVVGGVAGYFLRPPERIVTTKTERVTETVTKTVTVTPTPTPTVTPTPTPTPVKFSYKEAAKPYKGTTIRVVTESTPPAVVLKEKVAPKFEEETGIHVEWEAVSWGEMYAKEIADMEAGTGIYDAVYVEQDIIYTYMGRGWLTDITALLEEHPELYDPECDPNDFTAFGDAFKDPTTGHFYAYPYEAFLKTMWYRVDLYADPEIRKLFKEMHGYEMPDPAKVEYITWEDFINISKTFFEWGKDKEPRMYGCGFQMIGITLPYLFLEGFFPPHGVYTWGVNLEKMRASVEKGGWLNSDKAVKTFEDWFKLFELAPPETPTFSWGGNCDAMAAERTPHGPCEYSEAMAKVAKESPVAGKVRCCLPPLEPGVLDEVKARPKTGPGVWKAYVNYYDGGAFGIPWCSKNKEAAVLFVQYMTNKAGARVTTVDAFAPTRKSVLEEMIGTPLDKETGYFTLVKEKDWMYAPAPPFREHKLLVEKYYDKWIHKICAKEVGIKEGLDQLAKEVDEIFEALGY